MSVDLHGLAANHIEHTVMMALYTPSTHTFEGSDEEVAAAALYAERHFPGRITTTTVRERQRCLRVTIRLHPEEKALFVLLQGDDPVETAAATLGMRDGRDIMKVYDAVRFAGPAGKVEKVVMFLANLRLCDWDVYYDWITLPYGCLEEGYKQLVVTQRRLSARDAALFSAPHQLSEAVSKMTLQP